MIKDIESLRANAKLHPLAHLEVLEECQVHIEEMRSHVLVTSLRRHTGVAGKCIRCAIDENGGVQTRDGVSRGAGCARAAAQLPRGIASYEGITENATVEVAQRGITVANRKWQTAAPEQFS